MNETFDFAGWATRANLRCSDGRIITKGAFKECDGKQVPLVWNHCHNDPDNVLGHALLKYIDGDIRAECYFNDTESGQTAKELVMHGDINQLSIYANKLKEQGSNVIHGIIREVSLVLAGANPGAFIDSIIAHSDDELPEENREECVLYTGEYIELMHSDMSEDDESESETEEEKNDNETVQEIFNSMTEKQQLVVMAMLDDIVQNEIKKNNTQKEETDMKHNVFDENKETNENVLSHSDGEAIVKLAKSYGGGSLKAAYTSFFDEKMSHLSHDDLGVDDIDTLFPEYKNLKTGAPEMLTTDQAWIAKVLNKVHKSPISRIRTRQADVRDITDRRAKGYTKGSQKTDAGNISLISRTTDPTTIYIRSKLNRDDIIDITDFDIVQYMYNLDRMNLNEELARQITIGDGRSGDGDTNERIDPTKIRPIWLDDEMYCIHKVVDVAAMRNELTGTNSSANFGDNYVYAEAVIQSLLYAREKYKGTGNPDFICAPHLINVMLLARDLNGRRIYDNINELKAALNVNEIITADQYAGKTRTASVQSTTKTYELLGLLVNFADYSLGSTKGGEITHFTDFDINFNREVSLLETRCSGALTRPNSAIALEIDVTDKV